jgi:hypothetical protein
VFGLKVRLEVINLGDMAQYGRRDVFEDGRRTRPLAFTEERQFEIGRMMRLNIAGTFCVRRRPLKDKENKRAIAKRGPWGALRSARVPRKVWYAR